MADLTCADPEITSQWLGFGGMYIKYTQAYLCMCVRVHVQLDFLLSTIQTVHSMESSYMCTRVNVVHAYTSSSSVSHFI